MERGGASWGDSISSISSKIGVEGVEVSSRGSDSTLGKWLMGEL